MKRCPKCGEDRKLEEFHIDRGRRDGLQPYCIPCKRAQGRYYYDRNPAPHIRRKYERLATEQGRAAHRAAAARYRAKNRQKCLARTMVHTAIKSGSLLPLPCEVCGVAAAEAHHDDYGKPLDVRWLCTSHHFEHHKKLRREA